MKHGVGWRAVGDRVEEVREPGFTLVELLVVIAVLGILAGVVVIAVTKVVPLSVGASCAANVQTVETAEHAYELLNPEATQLTVAELTDPSSGTLQSWPDTSSYGYELELAGDGSALVGTLDANGATISMNDVVLKIGSSYFDASKSGVAVCFSL